jgi:hypothetical protein
MADQLTVDLQVTNLQKASADVEKFGSVVVAANQNIQAAAAVTEKALTQAEKLARFQASAATVVSPAATTNVTNFSSAIAKVETQALNLSSELRNISKVTLGVEGVNGLGKAAAAAQIEVRRAYDDLRSLEALASVTKEPVLLEAIRLEAARTSADLDSLEKKIQNVAAGRAAGQQRAGAAGAGSGINARGLLGTAGFLGVPGAFEASIAADSLSGLGIGTNTIGTGALSVGSAGFLAAGAGVAAAGFEAVKISQKLRDDAAARLKAETAYQVKLNEELLTNKEILRSMEEQTRERKFQARIAAEDDPKALQAQLDKLNLLRNAALARGPKDQNFVEFNRQAEELQIRLEAATANKRAREEDAFNQTGVNNINAAKQAAEFENERRTKRFESINAARAEVQKIGEAADAIFRDLAAKQGESNPFVRVFSEARDLIEKTTDATKNLTTELQNQAAAMVANINANNLFSARLDNRLAVSDLRDQAANFRRPIFDKNLAAQLAQADTGLFNDPTKTEARNRQLAIQQALKNGTIDIPAPVSIFDNQLQRQSFARIQALMKDLQNGGTGLVPAADTGLFANPVLTASRNRIAALEAQLQGDTGPISVSERLSNRLAEARRIAPSNAEQQAILDRRIIGLAQGINPADLTEAQRRDLATVFEREAEARAKAEDAAAEQRKAQQATQSSIDTNIAALLTLANKEGFTGVIRIINQAEDVARDSIGRRRRARDLDAANFMQP